MIGLPRPTLPAALPAVALLLVAGAADSADSQAGGEMDVRVGGASVVEATQPSSLPVPQPAPDRPPPHPRPEPEKAAPRAQAEPEPDKSSAPSQSQSEQTPSPAPAKPEGGTPSEGKTETSATLPKNLRPIPPEEAVGILGKKVYGPADEDMGMMVDVVVGGDGRPRAAVIDFGGFLGVGSRKIAVDWELLQFRPVDRDQPVRLSLGRAEVQAAPEYKPSIQQAEIVAPPTPADAPAAPDAEK